MGMMTCVMCGAEMSVYNPLRRCPACQKKAFREGVYRSFERLHEREPYYSASPEPETTDWLSPMAERFREELGLEPHSTPDALMTERYSTPPSPHWNNVNHDKFDAMEATRWHGLRRSEEELLSVFSEREQANLRFYKHMVAIGVVEHQTEAARDEAE